MKRFGIVGISSVCLIALTSCARQKPIISQTPAPPRPISTGSNQPGLVPAGTTIEVRTNEPIHENSAAQGRPYTAEIVREIVNGTGALLVPKGSPAQLVVLDVKEGGRIAGSQIELGLKSVTINGKVYSVETPGVKTSERGLGANRRTAEMAGGGALLGTVLGAAAGGGRGAAIGALAGAAAGAAAQIFTKGKEVRVPAETVLTFRLEQPIRLSN